MNDKTRITFDKRNPFPGRPRILFVGLANSSHTQSWISLLEGAKFNIRLFASPESKLPPPDWSVRAYFSSSPQDFGIFHHYPPLINYLGSIWRKLEIIYHFGFFTNPQSDKIIRLMLTIPLIFYSVLIRVIANIINIGSRKSINPAKLIVDESLANVIQTWRPDIIHTLGFFTGQGGEFYYYSRKQYHLEGIGKWVAQARGGLDLALYSHLPEKREIITRFIKECDFFIADNSQNYQNAVELGLERSKIFPAGVVPGSGGIDLEELEKYNKTLPSQRERIILWPRAYDFIQSKTLPVLEALQLSWKRITPCEVWMTASGQEEFEIWFAQMPDEIKKCCHLEKRLPHTKLLELMGKARVLLIPSLSDGIPNSLYEAMGCGTFPIVSPLETITPVVKNEENVLFARNLYPEEIATALVRAMNDDALVDRAAEKNLDRVYQLADRKIIQKQVINFYENICLK